MAEKLVKLKLILEKILQLEELYCKLAWVAYYGLLLLYLIWFMKRVLADLPSSCVPCYRIWVMALIFFLILFFKFSSKSIYQFHTSLQV